MGIGPVLLKLGQAPAKGVRRLLYALVIIGTVLATVLKQAALPDILAMSVINALLTGIAFYDMEHRLIKNRALLLLLFLKLLWLGMLSCSGTDIALDILECVSLALFTMLLCLTVRAVVKRKGLSFGDGDFKLLIVIAFCMGITGFLVTLLCALILSVILCLIFRSYDRAKSIPAAPILSFAAIIGFLAVG